MPCHSPCSVHCGTGSGGTELLLETSYPELLSSTTVPSDAQISAIRDVIGAVEEQIDSKDREMARLQEVITNLSRQRAELRVFANTHIGMISGMRCLPSELLTEIFLQYVRMETRFRGPWIIATVCSRWRAVALSSPVLWCHFLDIRRRTPVALLSKQLERSKNAPIYLNFRSHNFQTAADSSLKALDLFLAASTRWREVTLELNFMDMSHLGAFAGSFPLLQTLAIMNRELGASLVKVFTVLPSLIELELHAIPTQITFPFSSLRRCTINHCSSADVLRILSLLASGTEFTLRRCFSEHNVVPKATTSQIQILHFKECSVYFLRDVLRTLVAPTLTDFAIRGDYGTEIALYIVQFLSKSQCPLTRLSLTRTQISADDLRRVLELIPAVVELEIEGPPESQAILHVITTSDACIAPLLRRLVLHGEVLDRVSVMCMLRSRVGVLQSVGLDFSLPYEDVEELYAHRMQVNSCSSFSPRSRQG
ncbi:hypothetical protein C8J57DRAFT_1726983 [Mycena rebaudengoi]|nr:hypothetical protein C8J57DRAFT_1726983 [Mycena rebaudengoi]